MEQKVLDLIERGVAALEKLNEDPVIRVETGPPACPHCERVNPTVRTAEDEGTGAMAEIVYKFQCMHCSKTFFGVPLQWSTTQDVHQAADVIAERAEIGGYN